MIETLTPAVTTKFAPRTAMPALRALATKALRTPALAACFSVPRPVGVALMSGLSPFLSALLPHVGSPRKHPDRRGFDRCQAKHVYHQTWNSVRHVNVARVRQRHVSTGLYGRCASPPLKQQRADKNLLSLFSSSAPLTTTSAPHVNSRLVRQTCVQRGGVD